MFQYILHKVSSFKVPLTFLVCRKLIVQTGFTVMIGMNFNATRLTSSRNTAKLALMMKLQSCHINRANTVNKLP